MPEINPFRDTDDEARDLARSLIATATFGSIAVLDPDSKLPSVTRIALATDVAGAPISLMSTLSSHTQALDQDPNCSLLVGEPPEKGDPLTHPRITLQAQAHLIERDDPAHEVLRGRYLDQRPKAKLYIDFTDFRLVTFSIQEALLNGGFGKAYKLTADDLIPK